MAPRFEMDSGQASREWGISLVAGKISCGKKCDRIVTVRDAA